MVQTGSTNTDLLALAASGLSDPAPRVLLAQHQTAGRGRQGRPWWAQPGDSLTFSLGLPLRPRHGWGALSLVVGEAVARVLQPWPQEGPPSGAGRLMLKWPNDLWWYDHPPQGESERAAGAKVAGILIETQALGGAAGAAGSRWVVIGIGVNVQAPREGGIAVAGTRRWRPDCDAVQWWHALVPVVLKAVRDFERNGFAGTHGAVERRDLLVGQRVSLSAGPVGHGRCTGIESDGALRVESEAGVHRIVAGEVSVRPQGD